MSGFICLLGEQALSGFRERKLRRAIAADCGLEVRLQARHCYLVECFEEAASADIERLQSLLNAELSEQLADPGLLLVTPRPGTQSPWSSKATDIAQRCGLSNIRCIERTTAFWIEGEIADQSQWAALAAKVHDRMTQAVFTSLEQAWQLFEHRPAGALVNVTLAPDPASALQKANQEMGLALSASEIDYLCASYKALGRDPTDAELMMFAQANSEHCRHKIFNASWTVDGEAQAHTLFGMIRNTHACAPAGVLSAYHDNSAVIEGSDTEDSVRFFAGPLSGEYGFTSEPVAIQIKVETHNHPTAISPFAGAATGSGGEIRDEAATGRGARPKAGLTGFSVSNLHIPGIDQPWAMQSGKPGRIASALEIMTEGPLGAASFNNEFGRPALGGYFRCFEQQVGGRLWGYHKPIMVAGGMGNIRPQHVKKNRLAPGDAVLVIGGPAMLIGLGGGAASSMGSGVSDQQLDFASVQRGNPEMQRRCQEVIDQCWALDENNPIVSIHDVGAGGLSNALPELLYDSERGGILELDAIPCADDALSPMETWCNEAQERYVLAVRPGQLEAFQALCQRERCPVAVLGHATEATDLLLKGRAGAPDPVALPLPMLLGKTPAMQRDAWHEPVQTDALAAADMDLAERLRQVMRHPTVGSKSFLITIGDRSVGGLVARDQMVGPWQVPVADAAVTLAGFSGFSGEAMAMGERTPLAIVNGPASGRMAVGEALTNIASAPVRRLADVRLSANWMAAAGESGQDATLYDTVRAVGLELCPALGIAIPVGKDSLSLKTVWRENDEAGGEERRMLAPVSLVVTAFAPVADARRALTPQLRMNQGASRLLLLDLGRGQNRLGGSIFEQVQASFTDGVPDLDDADDLSAFFRAIQRMNRDGLLLAYHDRSDGGLLASLCEMAFAGRCGLRLELDVAAEQLPAALFAEELGAVLQVRVDDLRKVRAICRDEGISDLLQDIGRPVKGQDLKVRCAETQMMELDLASLLLDWSETSLAIQRLRDNPDCADQERAYLARWQQPLLRPRLDFEVAAPMINTGAKPVVAILREQGVNGQIEMAAAFHGAGFRAVDVHMSDLHDGRQRLTDFQGLVACGGFSYGDVLGAGRGWANSILFNEALRTQFAAFFAEPSRFALGVCNGCQMMSALRSIIPGTEGWPDFLRNQSEQFEARLSMVRIEASPSVFFEGMAGALLPVASAHGEGRAVIAAGTSMDARQQVMRYVDANGQATIDYPANPNGSAEGLTGVCNQDGRVTILMPHPERTLRSVNFSWAPAQWDERSPWQRMFQNANKWVG